MCVCVWGGGRGGIRETNIFWGRKKFLDIFGGHRWTAFVVILVLFKINK